MTAYLASWLPVLQSVLPRTSPETAPFPALDSPAPAPLGPIDLAKGTGKPTLVAFVRHCGCPFADKETKLLAEQSKKYKDLHVVIVQHSEQRESEEWFEKIGSKALFPSPSKYTLIADPERKIYAAWGIGQVGWTGMVNSEVMGAVKALQDEGIGMSPTGKGSWRWQNSGGFAVDGTGRIRWRKLAGSSSDVCDYAEAAGTVV